MVQCVVGIAKLGVEFDASCIITHAYQPCPATLLPRHWGQMQIVLLQKRW